MMQMFTERRRRAGLLSSFFRPIPGSTGSTGKTILWDSERFSDQVAAVVEPGTGVRLNTVGRFTTKELEPARYAEAIAIDVNDLVNRMAGENPFDAARRPFTARFIATANKGLVEMERKIAQSMELQSSQILQTGLLNIPGSRPYVKDFKPKATHFPTAGIAWSNVATAVPLSDLESLCDVIQTDSKATCNKAILGRTALAEFLNTDQVKESADLRRVNLIDIDPEMKDRGATRYGLITVGQFELELWAYNEKFEPAGGGAKTPFVDVDKVILLPDNPGLVVGSTIVPRVLPPDPRVAGFVSVPTKADGGWDLVPNIWADAAGDVIYAGFYASAVMIPQGIDEFGCLTT